MELRSEAQNLNRTRNSLMVMVLQSKVVYFLAHRFIEYCPCICLLTLACVSGNFVYCTYSCEDVVVFLLRAGYLANLITNEN